MADFDSFDYDIEGRLPEWWKGFGALEPVNKYTQKLIADILEGLLTTLGVVQPLNCWLTIPEEYDWYHHYKVNDKLLKYKNEKLSGEKAAPYLFSTNDYKDNKVIAELPNTKRNCHGEIQLKLLGTQINKTYDDEKLVQKNFLTKEENIEKLTIQNADQEISFFNIPSTSTIKISTEDQRFSVDDDENAYEIEGEIKKIKPSIKYDNYQEPYIDEDNPKEYKRKLRFVENYKTPSEKSYSLFRGDCWTINNNFESSAAITSKTESDLTVNGTFRTQSDMIGIYWNSKDTIEHPYISYGEVSDYSDVILDFDYNMNGCVDFNDGRVSITIETNDGNVYYLAMNRFIRNNHVKINFNDLTILPGNTYIENGQSIIATEEIPVDVTNIKYIMFVLIPENYEWNNEYTIMENQDFYCKIKNINVKNGFIKKEYLNLDSHGYRLCEGYDDIYHLNPYRLANEMRKLGYMDWLDLYIGASHFYEKEGTVGDKISDLTFNHNRTEKMVLDPTVPLNNAFISWLKCYCKELKKNDFKNLVISVSMENLQCPIEWRQVDSNENFAITGWIPSTFFYSPCNEDVIVYMQKVSAACLDILKENNIKPILQMGEAWWWWNENDRPNQPPCFYDESTKEKFREEFGRELPVYSSSSSEFDEEAIDWLNHQLVNYSDRLRAVVKHNDYKGDYMALFFPPSVTDTERVPPMMREVNYLEDAYTPSKLDVLQLEDYDWVTGKSKHHDEVYLIGPKLGFPDNRIHYFGGFVQYPEDSEELWPLIEESMEEAKKRNIKEIFVWAGSQVRRDNKLIGYEDLLEKEIVIYKDIDISDPNEKTELILSSSRTVSFDLQVKLKKPTYTTEQNIKIATVSAFPLEWVRLYGYYCHPFNKQEGYRFLWEKEYTEESRTTYDRISKQFDCERFYIQVKFFGIGTPLVKGFPQKEFDSQRAFQPNPNLDKWGKIFGLPRRIYRNDITEDEEPYTFPKYYKYPIEQDYWYEKRMINEYTMQDEAVNSLCLQDSDLNNIIALDCIYPYADDIWVYAETINPKSNLSHEGVIETPCAITEDTKSLGVSWGEEQLSIANPLEIKLSPLNLETQKENKFLFKSKKLNLSFCLDPIESEIPKDIKIKGIELKIKSHVDTQTPGIHLSSESTFSLPYIKYKNNDILTTIEKININQPADILLKEKGYYIIGGENSLFGEKEITRDQLFYGNNGKLDFELVFVNNNSFVESTLFLKDIQLCLHYEIIQQNYDFDIEFDKKTINLSKLDSSVNLTIKLENLSPTKISNKEVFVIIPPELYLPNEYNSFKFNLDVNEPPINIEVPIAPKEINGNIKTGFYDILVICEDKVIKDEITIIRGEEL